MNVGDTVKCVKLGGYKSLTLGKVYTVSHVHGFRRFIGLENYGIYPRKLFIKTGETE